MCILKLIFLTLAIVYGFCCIGKLVRKQQVKSITILLMAVGVVGFLATQGWI